MMPGPLTVLVCKAEATVAAGRSISDCSIDFLKRRQSVATYSVGASSLVRFTFNLHLFLDVCAV